MNSLLSAQAIAFVVPAGLTSSRRKDDLCSVRRLVSCSRVPCLAPSGQRALVQIGGQPVLKNRGRWSIVKAVQTSPAGFDAKEMERVGAKEALLLAIKDAGGVEALSSGRGSAVGRVNVSEKVLALERLNPTPRPTTSAYLDGTWEFLWASARSPGLQVARNVLRSLPPSIATIDSLKLQLSGGESKAWATLKFLGSFESVVSITSKLTVEGNYRLKEEYSSALLNQPQVDKLGAPSSVMPVLDGLTSAYASLPAAVKEGLEQGLRVPLTGFYERLLLISYLDDELMIARDSTGVADVLVRSEVMDPLEQSLDASSMFATEYET